MEAAWLAEEELISNQFGLKPSNRPLSNERSLEC